jgi:phosphoglycolate phosphatase
MDKAITAILLDLDGTLVDSAPELARAVNEAFAPLARRKLGVDEIRGMIGNGIPVLTERALAATGGVPEDLGPEGLGPEELGPEEDAAQQIIARVRRIYDTMPAPRVYDGVIDTLALWHEMGLTLIICTNKPENSARQLIAALGFDRFIAALAGGDTYANRKPHPDHLLKPLQDLGLEPGAAVMVGDSQIDAGAAHGAGIPFIAVSYGYAKGTAEALGAARLVDRFTEVTEAVAQLAGERGLAFPPAPDV